MSIIRYRVSREDLRIEDGLDSPKLEKALEALEKRLETDPFPAEFGCEQYSDHVYRIRLPHENDQIQILYEVEGHEISLIAVRRRWITKLLDAINDLMDFAPKKDP